MLLPQHEQRMAEVLARALLPAGVMDGAFDHAPVGEEVAREVRRSPLGPALLIRLSLWLAWLAPLWLSRRPRSFGGLPPDEQVALLERLLKSDSYLLRMAMTLLKITLVGAILGNERALSAIGAYKLDVASNDARDGAQAAPDVARDAVGARR